MPNIYDRDRYSILNTDLYKLTMQNAVLHLFPDVEVEYRFQNRRKSDRFTARFVNRLWEGIRELAHNAILQPKEYEWAKKNLTFFTPSYFEYLKNYRFRPEQVTIALDDKGQLDVRIRGLWHETILWEVPLLAMISELHYEELGEDTNNEEWMENQYKLAQQKAERLQSHGCFFADFGTRRRRSYMTQREVVRGFINSMHAYKSFVGTSNVFLAMTYGVKAIGTMAHEWIMAHSVLDSLRHANFYALQNWVRVYNANLGIALTDTYGTEAFLNNFNLRLSKLWDGVRQDSGDPFSFADKIISHYHKLGIDPLSKTIVFSDALNVKKAIEINEYCAGKIKCSFGIGTHFSNDFEGEPPPLNIVIKLWSVNDIPVVKLSDDVGKIMGDPDAIRVAQWTHLQRPLDGESGV